MMKKDVSSALPYVPVEVDVVFKNVLENNLAMQVGNPQNANSLAK